MISKAAIGARITRIRESKSLGPVAFASIAGVSQGQLHNYEHGLHYPALPALERICRAAGIRMSDFLRDDALVPAARQIPTETQIGNNIASWRMVRGLTRRALADKSGVGDTTLAELEHGTRYGNLSTYLYLATALDISLAALVYGEEE